MDTINQLTAWLERPVYEEGVLLYQRLIGAGFVLSMLKSGPDDYNRNTLTAALETKRAQLLADQQTRLESFPEALTDSLEVGKLLMDERTVLKERLRLRLNGELTQTDTCKELAFRILDIRDALGTIYGRKDFFVQHGYLPEAEGMDADQTPAQLMKRMLTVRTYVTRYNKLVNSTPLADPRYQTNLNKLRHYQGELHQVEQQLNAMMTYHAPLHH